MIALIITAIAWVLCLLMLFRPLLPEWIAGSLPITGRDASASLRPALGVTLLSAAILAIRTLSIYNVFKNGDEITGTIKVLRIKGSRGYIIYTYNHEGKEFSNTASLNFSNKLKSLFREGGPIVLAVRKDKPGQALIRDLYLP